MAIRDPDESIVALFKNLAVKNNSKTATAGRPIYDDMEVVELRYPGSRNVGVYPATAMSHWGVHPETGEQMQVTYAERFMPQYQQFKRQDVQTKAGTPLMHAPFLTEARKAELRALNLYTVEALAAIDGFELKNLGPGGRDLKNQAIEYIEQSKTNAVDTKIAAEIEALRARNAILEEDMALLKAHAADPIDNRQADLNEPPQLATMDLQQLREFIHTNTGQELMGLGPMNRKTLVRLAQNCMKQEA